MVNEIECARQVRKHDLKIFQTKWGSRHKNQIDYIVVNSRLRNSIVTAEAYPGCNINFDHNPSAVNDKTSEGNHDAKDEQLEQYREYVDEQLKMRAQVKGKWNARKKSPDDIDDLRFAGSQMPRRKLKTLCIFTRKYVNRETDTNMEK